MVDRRSLTGNDMGVLLRTALDGFQTTFWTALPGIIQSFNAEQMTCVVQPSIQATVMDADGKQKWVSLPQCLDCPVMFPSAGGFSLTFPIKAGDECLLIFASRCIDSWWNSGGVAVQAELRMHDLSDGFVMLAPKSRPNWLTPPADANSVQLRSDDGEAFISIDSAKDIKATTTGNIETDSFSLIAVASNAAVVDAPNIIATGNVTVNGNLIVTGTVTMGDASIGDVTSFLHHQHFADGGGGPNKSGFPLVD